MTFFENILKKRLGDATSTKGVAPDDLWAAIEQELPPEEEVAPPVRWGKIGWVLLGLLLALAISLSVALREEVVEMPTTLATESPSEGPLTPAGNAQAQLLESDDDTEGTSSNEEELVIVSEDVPQELRDEVSASDQTAPSTHVSEADTHRGAENTSAEEQAAISPVLPNDQFEAEKKEVLTQQIALDSDLINDIPEGSPLAMEDDVMELVKVAETTTTRPAKAESGVEARKTVAVGALEREPQVIAPIMENNELAGLENFKAITPVKQLRRPRTALGVFVGSNMLRHKYPSTSTDDLADVLNGTRGEALGQSAALEFGYRLRPGLKVYTGLELLKTHTTFRYTQQWDTVTMRNGQEVDAIATRRVQHNNRQTLLSVPLMLEKTFAAGRWEAGLATGLSFNYLAQQTGRSLNALRQVVAYSNEDETNLPAPNFYLSYQLRPSVNYRLSNRMSIQARVDLRWQRYGKSALYELPVNSMLYGGSFGVVFGL
jgi:hypothetical protein